MTDLFTFEPHPTNIDKVRVSIPCCECRKTHRFDIDEAQWFSGLDAMGRGDLIQLAFPNLAPHHRETLISRICPSCFDSICHD
jgi:hypothetical protein